MENTGTNETLGQVEHMVRSVVLDMPNIGTRGNLVLARGHPCGWSSQDLSFSASVEPACSHPGLVAATRCGCRPATLVLPHKALTTKLQRLDLPIVNPLRPY